MTSATTSVATDRVGAEHGWINKVFIGLVIYVLVCAIWMLGGFGSDQVRHYVGLLADSPACLSAVIIAGATARRLVPGAQRSAWRAIAAALGLYYIGTTIAVVTWLHGHDPFPGPADIFYSAFYPAFFIGVLFLIRAAAVRVPWLQLTLDATIMVVGFGAFFWFLVIRPASTSTEIDIIKNTLSQAYLALNCMLLLTLGVLLIAGARNPGGRGGPLLLTAGFAMMSFGDILWSVGKITGSYLPGKLEDVLYVACYVPFAAAARAQLRASASIKRSKPAPSDALVQSLPYAAMLAAFLVLVYFARGDVGGATTFMTMIVFSLTLLLMIRQALILRDDASMRERRAARLVEDRYASLIANASDVIMIVAADGALRFASPASERLLGLRPEQVAETNLLNLWSGEEAERLKAFLDEVAATQGRTVGPVEVRVEHGVDFSVLEIVGSNLTNDPAVQGLALNFRDISERKALEEQLRQLAFHDPLTLLANRNLFRDRVQHALALARRAQQQVAVMFLDLDNFKNINDSFGHDAGDRLLQAVSQRVVKTLRGSDTVARLGGDEFAILIEGFAIASEIDQAAAALVEALEQPFTINATEVRMTASIGVALSTPQTGAEALLSKADIAMYHAKSSGKNRFVAFRPQMQELLLERVRLEADLARAFENEEFFLEYQPIVDLGTRSLLGVEALVRWRHPELGVLSPGQFIQVAEECGQIVKLGCWVLSKACTDVHTWRRAIAGGEGLRVSVNISGRHLQHGGLVRDVARALEVSGLEPSNLVIELTESTIMHDTDANLGRLRDLKALGVRLAIDDFGTGYSSLSYLHRFPIDILKIDHSFVSRLTNTDNGPELARAVITLSETLGLDTVAEGIELEPQVDELLALGCVAGQGYLFSKATALEKLTGSEFVARRVSLWSKQVSDEKLSPTGRFKALNAMDGRKQGIA